MKERDIEAYLVEQVKGLGGEVRKLKWVGRRGAPDRVLMLPHGDLPTIWVEVKNPESIKTFPADARERAQAREHARMRAAKQVVAVVGTYDQVDRLLR
jgi:hypothetical protein